MTVISIGGLAQLVSGGILPRERLDQTILKKADGVRTVRRGVGDVAISAARVECLALVGQAVRGCPRDQAIGAGFGGGDQVGN